MPREALRARKTTRKTKTAQRTRRCDTPQKAKEDADDDRGDALYLERLPTSVLSLVGENSARTGCAAGKQRSKTGRVEDPGWSLRSARTRCTATFPRGV